MISERFRNRTEILSAYFSIPFIHILKQGILQAPDSVYRFYFCYEKICYRSLGTTKVVRHKQAKKRREFMPHNFLPLKSRLFPTVRLRRNSLCTWIYKRIQYFPLYTMYIFISMNKCAFDSISIFQYVIYRDERVVIFIKITFLKI